MFETLIQGQAWMWIRSAILLIYAVTAISLIVVVISENRNPVKSLAWVTVLLLLPLVGIILYLFFGRNIQNTHKVTRRNRRKMKKKEPPHSVDFRDLHLSGEAIQQIKLGHTLTGSSFYTNNDIEVFTYGEQKFARLKEDLINAKEYINLEYYIFEDDKIGNEIADILISKAQSGVTVRVIYDDVGCLTVKKRFFKRMRAAGVMIYPFFKVSFPLLGTRVNWRNHRKICVIDGNVGYIGGMNIADRYITGGKFACWRDTHLRIEGPVLAAMQYAFAVDWHFMGQPLVGECAGSKASERGKVAAQIVTSGPTSQWTNIAFMIHKAIAGAKQRVYIQTPYFLPTDALLKDIITAALSRVDVRIMLPRRSDSRLLDYASASFISECMRAGVKFFHYEAGMMHSKMIIIDDEQCTIGSTNFDFRSFEHNFESNIFLYSKPVTEQMLTIFRTDMAQSTRLTMTAWQRRPFLRKATESIVRLLSPIL